ncbi:MAG: hypothetical protein FWD28_06990 [Treponema sp.]|nr:hypothetical protein [Treponema sp.]
MKKLIAMTVILSAFAGAVYAQGLSFGGYFNSGLGVISIEDQDPTVRAFGVDSESNGYRFRFNGSYQNEERTAGFRFRLQSQRSVTGSVQDFYDDTYTFPIPLSIPFAYGFMNFFENKLNLNAGIVDDSAWQTADWWLNDDVGEGLGVLVKLNNIIDGLSLGFGGYTISQRGGGDNNQLARPINFTPALSDIKYVISGSYTMKDTFYIGGSFRTENTSGSQTSSQFMGDFRLLAVEGLTAIVAVSLDNLQNFENAGNIVISETFAFKVNDEFNVGLNAVQFFYNRPTDLDPGFLFNLWGSYAFGDVIPRIDLVYFIKGQSNTSQQYHRRGYAATANNNEISVFSVRPSVRINLDSRTHLEIGDVVHFNNNAGTNIMTNVFYVDFRWSF